MQVEGNENTKTTTTVGLIFTLFCLLHFQLGLLYFSRKDTSETKQAEVPQNYQVNSIRVLGLVLLEAN